MAQLNTKIVLRNDTSANWLINKDKVLLKGEIGIEFLPDGTTKMKIGDSSTTWERLPYFGGDTAIVLDVTPQEGEDDVTAIRRVAADQKMATGHVAIVKRSFANNKTSITAYVYNGTDWAAMDGNYNAENVYFDKDLVTTYALGNISLTNGQGTIAAKGKNLKELFDLLYVKEKNPTITQPSLSVSMPQAKSYEVGTKVTPSYTTNFNAGRYEFGPETGVTAETYSVVDNAAEPHTLTTATGSFPEMTVTDGISYKLTATVTHSAGATPKTNVGNDATALAIKKGSKVNNSGNITGYRNSFYGTANEKTKPIDNAFIRNLSKSGKALNAGSTFNITVPLQAMRVVFAYPKTLPAVTSVKDVNGMNAEISSSFSEQTVKVEGNNAYNAIDYRVYTLNFAEPNSKANTFKVTI